MAGVAATVGRPDGQLESVIRGVVQECLHAELGALFGELHRFIDRRIAELSAELHATSQLMDLGESSLSAQIGRIQTQIERVIAAPASAVSSSGVELEAVVLATEQAADRILEAAEAIGDWLRDRASSNLNATDEASALAAVAERVNAIFEACAFQDLTGQRIRRAIEHLQRVETMLAELGGGEAPAPPPPETLCQSVPDLAQAEIDRLLAG
jgi:chemotaxis protein CheZ